MNAPDQSWIKFIDALFGHVIAVMIFIIVMTSALGNVKQETSYGMRDGLTILAMLGSGWVGWKFGRANPEQGKDLK